MDLEVAQWLAELITQAIGELPRSPGLTIEVEHEASKWVQVIPEEHEEQPGLVSGYVINFPQRSQDDSPLDLLRSTGVRIPPDTAVVSHELGSHATIWVRPDIPIVALALFLGDILEKVGGVAPDYELNVQIQYGF